MQQQVAQINPRTGHTEIVYVDRGAHRALLGHGRRLVNTYALAAGGMANATSAGTKQPRLGGTV